MSLNEPIYAFLSNVLPDEMAAALSDQRVVAFALSVVASLGTFLGGLLTLVLVKWMGMTASSNSGVSGTLVGVLQAFSAGVMLYMTFMDLIPEATAALGARETMIYFFVGVAVFGVIEAVFLDDHGHDDGEADHDHTHDDKDHGHDDKNDKNEKKEKKDKKKKESGVVDINSEKGQKQLMRTSLITFWALLLHNMPEGLGVYLSALTDVRLGLQLAVAICLHNIPEGMAVAIPLYAAGGSSTYVLGMTLANGLAEPIGVMVGVAFFGQYLTPSVLSRCLAAVGGIMCCISIHELQPTAIKYAGQGRASISLFAGMFVVFLALEAVTEYFGHPHSHGGSEVGHGHSHGGQAHGGHGHSHGSPSVGFDKPVVVAAVAEEEEVVWAGQGESNLKLEKPVKFIKKGGKSEDTKPHNGHTHSHSHSHSHSGESGHSHSHGAQGDAH
ncbi:Zip-domain-containing protein [Rhizoclosmatium globosum]|uniref:Zip-domain-containing protein n=1 Tax=Rhizoclosmatium globosum TaxID=329046 RepID=A0A1Y2D1P4_9FUNG|nr:Zip-domain-containing protein [Rhizoclosmatium globosum]|eukprot:ORY53054.1 Zip-domain-containing protein [Rhizoclosmatium globosum]